MRRMEREKMISKLRTAFMKLLRKMWIISPHHPNTYKYIYWAIPDDMRANEKGEFFARVHLLVGYNQGSVSDFRKMAAHLRETFPQASEKNISCGTVTRSINMRGFTIIAWYHHIPKGEYPGWFQSGQRPDYRW